MHITNPTFGARRRKCFNLSEEAHTLLAFFSSHGMTHNEAITVALRRLVLDLAMVGIDSESTDCEESPPITSNSE